jgi:hypothetical protein
MRWFRKKMPDAILRRCPVDDIRGYAFTDLVCTYTADGARWCDFNYRTYLLREDGTVIGDGSTGAVWEFI